MKQIDHLLHHVHESRQYWVLAERGWMCLDPGFSYRGIQIETARADGMIERKETPILNEKNQFTTEMDHFSDYILANKQPFTPGEEGLQDQKIMAAIYQSARDGRPVKLTAVGKEDAFWGTGAGFAVKLIRRMNLCSTGVTYRVRVEW